MNLGRSTEGIVEGLCHRSFFADFVVTNPKYYKSSGLEKESADLLICGNDTLLGIQVKTKSLATGDQSPVAAKRFSRAVDKAIFQFRALAESFDAANSKSYVNGRGMLVPVEKERIKDVHLIVVVAPVWTDSPQKPPRLRLGETCYPEGSIAVHLFSLEEFSFLLTMLDTLPDFTQFLRIRALLHKEKLVSSDSDPTDEWALATFEKRRLCRVLEEKAFVDISGLRDRHQNSIGRLERREKPSYFVDGLVSELYDAIGSEFLTDGDLKLLAPPNSAEAYRTVINQFVRLNRAERGRLTEFLITCVQRSRRKNFAFRAFKFDEDRPDGYVVAVSNVPREERRTILAGLAPGAGHRLRAKTVIGLIVSVDWPSNRACDVVFADTSNIRITEKFLQMLPMVFGKQHYGKR